MSGQDSKGISRRRLLTVAGATGVGLAAGATGYALGAEQEPEISSDSVPFYGPHQAGITTAAQDRLHFAALDLQVDSGSDLRDLMKEWTAAAAAMCGGEPVGGAKPPLAPPADTGEAAGLPPARLTVTFGFGPALFEKLGMKERRPPELTELPGLPGDELDPSRSGGDLAIQACADDPQVAFHAVRNLVRIGRGAVTVRWNQLGFGRTSSTSRAQDTPRNLMGFKDGTNNIRSDEREALDRFVWVGDRDQPAWMRGGSYMVTRRIRMLIEVWDRTSLDDQQQTIGRVKSSGAPIGGRREFDEVDATKLQPDAHVRLAGPAANGGERILRRGYSFTDGTDTELGQLDAGLFFIAFQRDPHKQFVPLQRRLGSNDALNEYIKHVGSALFAVPPGARPGGYIGETLLG